MKNTLPALISIIIALVFIPSPAKATTNAANFGGGTGSAVLGGGAGTNSGVAIGTGYASTYLAPTNGLIVQGNVGIGTTSPQQALDATGAGNGTGTIKSWSAEYGPTGAYEGFNIYYNGTSWIYRTSDYAYVIRDDGNALGIYTVASGTAGSTASLLGTERFVVASSGNVAVGTTSPTVSPVNNLDVYGTVAIGTGYGGVYTAPSNGLLVKGSVGIGTTSPLNALDIHGAVVVGTGFAGVDTAPSNGLLVQGDVAIGTAAQQGLLTVYGASTVASAASAKLDYVSLPAATTTITGTTAITTAKGFNAASFYQPTYTDTSAVTITNAATLYVDNAPAAAGSVTITKPWAISVGAGNVSFPGTSNALGTITSGTWNGSPINLSSYASGTLQAAQEPAHTGDVTNTAGSLATTVAKIQGTTVSGTTGSGNVVFSASPTLTGTVTGASSNWSGNVNIGTTAPLNGATLTLGTQTATALMVNGSGSLAIGTSLFEGAGGVNLGSGGGYYINAANIGCGFCTQNVVTIVPGTVYHNMTGKTMFVSAVVNTTVLQQIYAYSDNKSTPTTLVSQYSVNSNGYTTLTFMVMNGNSYEVTGDNTADMSIIGTADY